MEQQRYWVYILKCSDNNYYTGCTSNLDQRLNQHNEKTFSNYTSNRLPVELVFSQEFQYVNEAIAAERQIKGWTRKKKEALINSDFKLIHELSQCRNVTHYLNKKNDLPSFDSAQDDR